MTAIHEIQQALWLDTPKGIALAKFMVDRGIDSDIEWVTILNETGQILVFDNSDVLVTKSYTQSRRTNWTQFQKAPNAKRQPK